jgi:hypothetical protein
VSLVAASSIMVSAAGATASTGPGPLAVMAPPSPDLEAATERYAEGVKALKAGDPADAAASFDEAIVLVPADEYEIRAAVLLDLVDARRKAYAQDEVFRHLCVARDALTDYLDEAEHAAGKKAKKYADVKKSRRLRADILEQMHLVEGVDPEGSCAASDVEGAEEDEGEHERGLVEGDEAAAGERGAGLDKRARTYLITGSVLAGVGLIFHGVMIGGLVMGSDAEAAGEAYVQMGLDSGMHVSRDDAEIADIERQGATGNALAIAGGVIGTLAAGAGVTLIVLALQRPSRRARAALGRSWSASPYLGPGSGGLGVWLRF